MRRTSLLFLWLFVSACPGGAANSDADGSSTAATTGAPTTGTPTTSTTGSDTGASTGVTTGAGSTTDDACDDGGFIGGCNQTCAAGEICVFEVSGDAAETECRPNPDGCVPSDPCSPACAALCSADTLCGGTCGGLMCGDPVTCGIGLDQCKDGKCTPSDVLEQDDWNGNEPVLPCPADMTCVGYVPAILMLCTPSCDPLQQDCPTGERCSPVSNPAPGYACFDDVSGADGQAGEPCTMLNGCDPGLVCVFADDTTPCGGDVCCTPYCDVNEPNTCPQAPEQVCRPAFKEQPPGYEHVGYCGVDR